MRGVHGGWDLECVRTCGGSVSPKKTKAVTEAMKAAAARVLDLALIQETESSVYSQDSRRLSPGT